VDHYSSIVPVRQTGEQKWSKDYLIIEPPQWIVDFRRAAVA
jgi:hypothetical protein